jgi:hypothetical protein
MSPPPCTLFEIDQRSDVVDGVMVFGDSQRPTELGPRSTRIGMGELANQTRRNQRRILGIFERVRFDRGSVCLEAFGRPIHELTVLQAGCENLAANGVGQGDIGADVESEPAVGPASARRLTRIDDEELRAVANPAQDVMKEDRVRLARIRSP